MFEHLDDPAAFDPAALRPGVRRRSAQLHRRRRVRRLAVAGAAPVVALAAGAALIDRRLDGVQRVDIGAGATDSDPLDVGSDVTVLLLGSDARGLEPGGTSPNHDSLLVARIGPAGHTTLLSLPRDLWTGHGRLNAMGAAELVDWLRLHLGIHVDHVVSLDMEGFVRLADRIRPRVRFERAVRDRSTGLSIGAGCRELDGIETLAYVRSRHLEDLPGDPAGWRADPTGDLGRITRTQALAVAVWGELQDLGPADLPGLVDLLAEHATLDARLTTPRLLRLATRLRSSAAAPATAVLPAAPRAIDGQAVQSLLAGDPATEDALRSVGGSLGPVDDLAAVAPTNAAPPAGATLGVVQPC